MNNRIIKVNIPKISLPGIPEINIQFLNGEITIPSRSGGYVVASGCGSGKTTAIREIILKEFDKGIIYSAFTIEECNEMYKYLIQNGEDYGLYKEDIIVLHSNYNDEGVDNNTLRNNPEDLANKKVIICTHYKLLNEYPESLLAYNRNILYKSRLSLLSRGKFSFDDNGVKKYPRQLVLIDELPTCKGFSFNVTKEIVRLLGVADLEERTDEKGRKYITAKVPIHYTNGNNYEVTEELYKDSGLELFNNSSESGKLKSGLALSMIYEDYDGIINKLNNINDRKPSLKLSYTIADQIASGNCQGETRYIIFDGTGDLTFYDSRIFNLISVKEKYSSPVTLNKFTIGYNRRYKSEEEFNCLYDQLISNLNIEIDKIKDIIKENEGTLIITWKDLKIKDQSKGIPVYGINDKREIGYIDYIKLKLNEEGFIEGNDYSIIHYMSGLDKATNEFRNFNSVAFLGEFHVPGYVVSEFNQDYRVRTDPDNYTLYQLVQAVCRTRIRNHRGEGINIYYSSDWNRRIINKLICYLSDNIKSESIKDTSLDFIKPKWRPVAKLFSNLDENFRHCIESGLPYKLQFTLDDIYEIIPMVDKRIQRYYPMINYFRKLGIEIVIESNNTRFTSTNNPKV